MSYCTHCERPARSRGLCNAHYKKLLKYGDPLAGETNLRGQSKFYQWLVKIDIRDVDECWPWTAGRNQKNYGMLGVNGGSVPAHRFGFEAIFRPLEPGEVVDHTCHNTDPNCLGGDTCEHRACQNPSHWGASSGVENVAAGKSFSAKNAAKTHCDYGHPLTPDNIYESQLKKYGRRVCIKCNREKARGLRLKKPAS